MKALREKSTEELKKMLKDLELELISANTLGKSTKTIKKMRARILTILHERGES